MALVRERTIPTEWPPPVGEVSANCKWHHIPEDKTSLVISVKTSNLTCYFIMLTHHSLWPIKLDKNLLNKGKREQTSN